MVSALLVPLFGLLFAAVVTDSVHAEQGDLALVYTAVLKVDDPDLALGRLIADAEAQGGYFARKSKERVELRLPAEKAEAYWAKLPALGLLADQNLESENLASQLGNLEAQLQAKRKMMGQYFELLQTASDSTLFQIEQAISGLQQEIDVATGAKILAGDRVHYARMTVDFSFHDRTAPLPTGHTHFPWLNEVSLQNLLYRFDYGTSP